MVGSGTGVVSGEARGHGWVGRGVGAHAGGTPLGAQAGPGGHSRGSRPRGAGRERHRKGFGFDFHETGEPTVPSSARLAL